jgi:hypothetical protein
MATYIQIGSTVTVGSGGAANIEFTSIPATYTDLIVKLSARTNDTSSTLLVTFNGSSSNLSSMVVYGTGAATGGYTSGTNLEIPALNFSTTTANTFNNLEMYIPNYAGGAYKTTSIDGVQETNAATTAFASLQAGLWSNTAAITQVTLTPAAGSFVQYSTASLYGIKKD